VTLLRAKGLLERLLIKYKDVFSKSPDDLGRTDRIKHHINTDNATPIRVPPRRLLIGKREIEKQEIGHGDSLVGWMKLMAYYSQSRGPFL
jgi:hypothetical protein